MRQTERLKRFIKARSRVALKGSGNARAGYDRGSLERLRP